jgi:hypothetical protein
MRELASGLLALVATASPAGAASTVITFDDMTAGQPPAGFSVAVTGRGGAANWCVQDAADAPSGGKILAQISVEQANMRFPLCILDRFVAADIALSVRFKPVAGRIDRAAGLVWRYQDRNNYYVVRANALEDNVVAYVVRDGTRTDLPVRGEGRTYGKPAPVPAERWSTLGVEARGPIFAVTINGQKLFEVEDSTIAAPGRVGLWTKADSVTLFDDFAFGPAPR